MSEEINLLLQGYEAYLKNINIELFNDAIAFVMATTAEDSHKVSRNLSSRHLWYSRSNNENIQVKYGFRYFGELLERFEDKTGSDIKNIRAIALAMAYAKDLITDDMFVGNQKANFLRKITRLSPDDVYLKGALYLLNRFEPAADAIFEELTQAIYTRTEELIFVTSLFDNFIQAVGSFKAQLVSLLGTARTMPVFGNINVYAWLIRETYHYYAEKGIRSKDMALLRALIELPTAFVKANSRYHGVLLDNGYTAEEIIYLNSGIIEFRPVPETIMRSSIVAEKIAVEFCKTFINSEVTHHLEAYEHLAGCLKKHESFNIKINGYEGIFDAIRHEIRITNPQTFIRLYRLISKKDVFRFDILDEKWDVLSDELEPEEYLSLFEAQLIRDTDHDRTQIRERIQKYDTLTGTSYMALFEQEHQYNRDTIFALLVKKGIIDLVSAFLSCPNLEFVKHEDSDKARPQMLLYLRNYIREIRNREAFDFFRFIFQKYSFDDMHRLFVDGSSSWGRRDLTWFFKDPFYKGPSSGGYYSDREPRFDIKRSFLSDDEHRELFGWLDDYMLQYHADNYIEFSILMLLDPFVSSLFPLTELRSIYDMVSGLNHKIVKENSRELKQKYLSEVELQTEREAEKAREQELKRRAQEQQLQTLQDELSSIFDGTFKSLLKFMSKHEYSFRNEDDAIAIAAKYLEKTLEEKSYKLDTKEISRFLHFSGKLLKKCAITYDGLKSLILKVEEEAENAENSRTAESDPDDE